MNKNGTGGHWSRKNYFNSTHVQPAIKAHKMTCFPHEAYGFLIQHMMEEGRNHNCFLKSDKSLQKAFQTKSLLKNTATEENYHPFKAAPKAAPAFITTVGFAEDRYNCQLYLGPHKLNRQFPWHLLIQIWWQTGLDLNNGGCNNYTHQSMIRDIHVKRQINIAKFSWKGGIMTVKQISQIWHCIILISENTNVWKILRHNIDRPLCLKKKSAIKEEWFFLKEDRKVFCSEQKLQLETQRIVTVL